MADENNNLLAAANQRIKQLVRNLDESVQRNSLELLAAAVGPTSLGTVRHVIWSRDPVLRAIRAPTQHAYLFLPCINLCNAPL